MYSGETKYVLSNLSETKNSLFEIEKGLKSNKFQKKKYVPILFIIHERQRISFLFLLNLSFEVIIHTIWGRIGSKIE